MKKFLNKILIVDGSYCLHRSLKAPALAELSTSSGVKSGGVFGTLRIVLSECRKFSGYYPIICWDAGLSPRRLSIYPDYKHNLDRVAQAQLNEIDPYIEEYRRQRGDLINIFNSLGIPSLRIYGWEGDDLMYILTQCSMESVVISDDKDLIQLVGPTTKVRRAMADVTLDSTNTDSSYSHPWYCIAKAIVGDPSDNIPKVAEGVGAKAAQQIAEYLHDKPQDKWKELLTQYEGKPGVKTKFEKVANNFDQFTTNFNLTDLTQVEVPEDVEIMVENSITPVVGHADFFTAMSWRSQYEINSIDFQQVLSTLIPYAPSVLIK